MIPELSLFFFSADSAERHDQKYQLLLEAARFADENGFAAVWTPERHFQQFGGLYGSPSITGAALAVDNKAYFHPSWKCRPALAELLTCGRGMGDDR